MDESLAFTAASIGATRGSYMPSDVAADIHCILRSILGRASLSLVKPGGCSIQSPHTIMQIPTTLERPALRTPSF